MIILDTHAWLWWAARPERLSKNAVAAIAAADELGVCPVSCWEIAMLVAKGRLDLDRDVGLWVKQALALPKVTLTALSAEIAVAAGGYRDLPGDPADRMIVATAAEHRAPLVTRDLRLRRAKTVRTVW